MCTTFMCKSRAKSVTYNYGLSDQYLEKEVSKCINYNYIRYLVYSLQLTLR